MTTPENAHPKRKLKFSHIVIIALFILVVVAMNSGGSSTTTTASAPKVDSGTHMACEHWRINLSNASVETTDQQIAGAQKVWKYASVSEIPEIVTNAKAMTAAMINQDSQAYLKYATAFGNACVAVGE
jgi:flagellar basal body-associated protein FliL